MCASELDEPDPSAAVLREHLTRLEEELAAVSALEPRTREALEAAAGRTRGVREQLRVVNATLRDLADRDGTAATARGLASRRAYAQGLIAEYLRTAAASEGAGEQQLRDRIAVLKADRSSWKHKSTQTPKPNGYRSAEHHRRRHDADRPRAHARALRRRPFPR